jgi:hypothetical protein
MVIDTGHGVAHAVLPFTHSHPGFAELLGRIKLHDNTSPRQSMSGVNE